MNEKKREKRQRALQPEHVADECPPIDAAAVRLAATREILGILGEEDDARFVLPPPQETFYNYTPEHTFCLLVQSDRDLNSLQIGTSYSRSTIIAALIALACGADVSRVLERRVQ